MMDSDPTQPLSAVRQPERSRATWLLVTWWCAMHASAVCAQSSDYCEKVRSRAAARAAILIAPRVIGEVLRYPSTLQTGPSDFSKTQLRFGMALSPVDMYRGFRINAVSEADCRAYDAASAVGDALALGANAYVFAAVQAQLEQLEKHRGEWQEIQTRAEQRLSAGIITTVELSEVGRRVDELERDIEQLRGRLAQIRAQVDGRPVRPPPLDSLEREYLARAYEYARRESGEKSIDAWTFDISGGVIPNAPEKVEWFFWLRLGYSLGGPWNDSHETDYLRARKAELQHSRSEVSGRVRELKRQLVEQREQSSKELSLVDKHLAFVVKTRATLATVEIGASAHARDALALEQIALEAEQSYLRALIAALAPLGQTGRD